jgi:hypothetical protein
MTISHRAIGEPCHSPSGNIIPVFFPAEHVIRFRYNLKLGTTCVQVPFPESFRQRNDFIPVSVDYEQRVLKFSYNFGQIMAAGV